MTIGVQKLAARIQYAYSERDIKGYNEEMGYWYEDAVDFINSHYADSKWDTPFWNFVKETHVKSTNIWYEAWLKDPLKSFIPSVDSMTLFHSNWQLWLIPNGLSKKRSKLLKSYGN